MLSLLDTIEDFKRRKSLAFNAFNKLRFFLTHKKSPTQNKIRRIGRKTLEKKKNVKLCYG